MREIIGYKGKSGSGGGGGSETPDSLHSISYAKVLDLVSEGEIQGLVDGMKSVYFNETPLQNADGTYNFKGATVDFRPGTQVQDPIDGFPDVSNEIGVGVELRSTSPWTKSLSNTQLTSISIRLGINALTKADTSNGNISGYTVAYKIELSTDGSAYEVVVDSAFSGKTTSQYQRSHRIKLPKAMTGWTVRVVRITPNANSSTTADTTSILTYTELIDARMRYPMSAIVGVQIDAAQFQSIPTRAYDLYGRILSVPSNYDPIARTYSGIWNGTFKPAWTNNPAWIFYDLLINGRYGLGNLIPSSYVDKWGLYQIAQYCDQMVPDGHGGTEPRFTCNLYLQSAAEAYKVLQDLAALFRGITYWAGGTIVASADMPQDPTYIFTAANVIDGKFHNTGSSKKTRYTVAVVSWNDPANFYKPKAEYVQDDEGLIRYGVQQLNLTAFGCTSQGQAQRAGKWALLTSRLETDVVTFSVALDALVVTPGQVVRIANPNKAGRRNGGRIRAAVGRVVTLDKAPVIAAGDSLSVILPTGISETKTVESISSNDVTVSGDWSVLPQAPAIWSVESTNLVAPTYRIISITQKDSLSFEISAIRHEPGKFGYIDNGTKIQRQPVTIQKSIPDTPTNLMFSSTPYWVDDSVSAVDGILSWTGTAPNYLVSYHRSDDVWTDKNVTTSSIDIKAMQPGDYSFSVTAVSSTGLKSQAATYTATVTPQFPPLPAVTGLALESAFITNSAKLKWNGVTGATSYKMSVVANGVTVRTIALGNALRYEYNTADMKADGGPWRNVSFNVQAFGKFGTQSPVASLSANNPQIGALTNIRIDAGIRTGFFKCTPPGDDDFAGIIVWISTDPTCPATDGNKVYDGQDTFVTISKLGDGATSLAGDQVYYVRAAAYDTFGKDSLTISSAIALSPSGVLPDAKSISESQLTAALASRVALIDGPSTLAGSVAQQMANEINARQSADTANANSIAAEINARATADTVIETQVSTVTARINSGDAAPFTALLGWKLAAALGGWGSYIGLAEYGLLTSNATNATLLTGSSGLGIINKSFSESEEFIGSSADKIRLRLRKNGAPIWLGNAYYGVRGGHIDSASYFKKIPEPLWGADDWAAVEWDMSSLNFGGTDWLTNTITYLRIDLCSGVGSGYDIEYISIGSRSGTSLQASVNAVIKSEQTVRASADVALGLRVDSVQSQVGNNTAAINSEAGTRASSDAALSSRIDTVTATANGNTAAISSESTARSNADSALGLRIDTLTATANGNTAAISNEAAVRSSADAALATQVSTVQTTVNGNTASIQQQATSINGLSAQYTIKTDVNGNIAGIGLASTSVNGQPISDVTILSDRFALVQPGVAKRVPFVVTSKNGVAQIGFDGSVIVNGSMTGDAFAFNSITGDKVQAGSVSANVFSSGIAGNNLLENSAFAATYVSNGQTLADGYSLSLSSVNPSEISMGVNLAGDGYHPSGVNGLAVLQMGSSGQGDSSAYIDVQSPFVICSPGQWIEASFYSGAHECTVTGFIMFFDMSGNAISYQKLSDNNSIRAGTILSSFYRHAVIAQAPSGATTCRFLFRKLPTSSGVGSWMFIQCPMIAAAMSGNQTAPSTWSPPGIGTQIHGGAIKTETITTNHLAANSISADKLASRELSAMFATIGTMRTATSGPRTEISDNVIKVFDQNGTMRVKIGNLSL